MKKIIYLLITCLIYAFDSWASPDGLKFPEPEDSLLEAQVNATVNAFKIQKAINDKNDREGKSYLNNYIVFPETSPYIKSKWNNQGQQLWDMESTGMQKVAAFLQTVNEDKGQSSTHYLIVASIYNYYYDVENYDMAKEQYNGDGKHPIFSAHAVNWRDIEDNPEKILNNVKQEQKDEYKQLINSGDITEEKRLQFVNALVEALAFEEGEYLNISIVITFYEWEFVKEGDTEGERYKIDDYYGSWDTQSDERTFSNSFDVASGFDEFQNQAKAEERELGREEAVLKLLQLTTGYFETIGREGDIASDITSEQGKHLVGMLLGWAAKKGIENTPNEQIRTFGKWMDLIAEESQANRQDPRLQWEFYLGYLEKTTDIELSFSHESELREDGSPSVRKFPEKALNTKKELIDIIANAEEDFIAAGEGMADKGYHFKFTTILNGLKENDVPPDAWIYLLKGHWRSFTVEERIDIISYMLKNPFMAGLEESKDINAGYISKVIDNTPDFQAKELLEKIAKEGLLEQMFEQLYTEVYYFGSDDLKDPVLSLAELWGKTYSTEEKMAMFMEIKEHNYIFFQEAYVTHSENGNTIKTQTTPKFTYKSGKLNLIVSQSIETVIGGRKDGVSTSNTKDSHPIDVYGVVALKDKSGKIVGEPIPAFVYAWKLKVSKNENLTTNINITIGLIGVALALPEVIVASGTTMTVIAYLNLAVAFNDLALEIYGPGFKEDPEWAGFVSNWEKISLGANIATLGVDGFLLVRKFYKANKVKVSGKPDKAIKSYEDLQRSMVNLEKEFDKLLTNKLAASSDNIMDELKRGKALFNKKDDFLDVYIHHNGTEYVAWIDGKTIKLKEELLADAINRELTDNIQAIRLFSCSDLESAELFAKYVDRPVIASDESLKVYSDGTVKGGTWWEITGNTKTKVDNPNPPNKGITDEARFVKLGNFEWGTIFKNKKFEGLVFVKSNELQVSEIVIGGEYRIAQQIKIIKNELDEIWLENPVKIIVIDNQKILVDGHHRFAIIKHFEVENIPVKIINEAELQQTLFLTIEDVKKNVKFVNGKVNQIDWNQVTQFENE